MKIDAKRDTTQDPKFGTGTRVLLEDDGFLWLVNRVVFHPRGYALAIIHPDDPDEPNPTFAIYGDGKEVWTFTAADDDEKFAAVATLFDVHHARLAEGAS